jgi:hypothetical protein
MSMANSARKITVNWFGFLWLPAPNGFGRMKQGYRHRKFKCLMLFEAIARVKNTIDRMVCKVQLLHIFQFQSTHPFTAAR